VFRDRTEAGRRLAGRLSAWRDAEVVVLGLPRGGVPVAAEVARALHAPLDVLVVRKVGVPWQPELALGAVGEGRAAVLNESVVAACDLPPETLRRLIDRAAAEVAGVVSDLRDGSPPLDVEGRTVLVVDDGVATGATARAAAAVLRHRGADHVVLAVPVAAPETAERLGKDYDEVVCVDLPERLGSVGEWYVRFGQVSTAEVRQILATART